MADPSTTEFTFDETSRYLDAGPYRLHYHEAGEGPVLLMLRCGHWVQVERKDDFERHVISFLGSQA